MGGTSTDVSLAWDGQMTTTRDWHIEYGQPICFPSIDIKTIGAGGGSIAWIDEAGALHSGPQSAGSIPGPACYGRGGEKPTNTDANLVLGRLGGGLVGGDLGLDPELAYAAIDKHIAKPLGLSVVAAAESIIAVANANMADAIRLVSIMRGYDPRDFALVAFGGAGALHGAALAKDLAIPAVIVPPHPGVTSAMGCLLVDIQHDLLTTYVVNVEQANVKEVNSEFEKLEAEARERLHKEGVAEKDIILKRTIDMRYGGQWRSLTVPVSTPFTDLNEAIEGFKAEHQREYRYQRDGAAIEIFRLNLTAIGLTPKAQLPKFSAGGALPKPQSTRNVVFDGAEVKTDIFWRDDIPSGVEISGPAVIQQFDSTTWVPPGAVAKVDEYKNLIINV